MIIKKVCEESKIIDILKMFSDTLKSLSQGDAYIKKISKKIYDFGNMIIICDKQTICGFAGYYANDVISRKAYVSMIAIRPEYRGYGYGRQLLNAISIHASKVGMEIIRLQVDKWNENALEFYKKCKFYIVEEYDNSFFMECRIEKRTS